MALARSAPAHLALYPDWNTQLSDPEPQSPGGSPVPLPGRNPACPEPFLGPPHVSVSQARPHLYLGFGAVLCGLLVFNRCLSV